MISLHNLYMYIKIKLNSDIFCYKSAKNFFTYFITIMEIKNNISFGAKFIKPVDVLKYSGNAKGYVPGKVSLIELLPDNAKDVKALHELCEFWGNDTFVNNILHSVNSVRRYGNDKNTRVFALTTQRSDFENVRHEDVAIAAEIFDIDEKIVKLNHLQKDPYLIYSYTPKPLNLVGHAMLNYLKELSQGKTITLKSTPSATWFYKRNGFKECKDNPRCFIWEG